MVCSNCKTGNYVAVLCVVAPALEYDCNSGLELIVLAVITVPTLKLACIQRHTRGKS